MEGVRDLKLVRFELGRKENDRRHERRANEIEVGRGVEEG